jgi:hypothetical protein
MGQQAEERNLLDASANAKATLATSRRSFIAGWKLCGNSVQGWRWDYVLVVRGRGQLLLLPRRRAVLLLRAGARGGPVSSQGRE